MSEFEKMLSGDFYNPMDKELVDLSLVCKDFISGITNLKQGQSLVHEIGGCGDYEFNAMTIVREIKQMV